MFCISTRCVFYSVDPKLAWNITGWHGQFRAITEGVLSAEDPTRFLSLILPGLFTVGLWRVRRQWHFCGRGWNSLLTEMCYIFQSLYFVNANFFRRPVCRTRHFYKWLGKLAVVICLQPEKSFDLELFNSELTTNPFID